MNKPAHNEHLIEHKLGSYVASLSGLNSTRAVHKSLVYQSLKKDFNRLTQDIEYGFYADDLSIKKQFYRAIAWNIDHGVHFEPVLAELKQHPDLSKADLFFLTQTDVGMARTENRNIARDLATALDFNYFFVPSYIHLCAEEGVNSLGLQGHALLSRYPLSNLRSLVLNSCHDKMNGPEKLLGAEHALVAEVALPHQTITAIVAHLDPACSARQRARQIKTLLDTLKNNPYPVLWGGTFNCQTVEERKNIFSFSRLGDYFFRGIDIFDAFREHGFDYEAFNESIEDKPDWFVGRQLKLADNKLPGVSPPKVIPRLKHLNVPITEHEPILVDFDPYSYR